MLYPEMKVTILSLNLYKPELPPFYSLKLKDWRSWTQSSQQIIYSIFTGNKILQKILEN